MRTVIISTQNTLLSDAVMKYMKERGLRAERISNPLHDDDIYLLCESLQPELLFMEVTQTEPFTYDKRMEVVVRVKAQQPSCKIALICDEVTSSWLAERVANAKRDGLIDNFFYSSVSGEYLAASLEAM